jgi:hypothetical protein
LEAYSPESSVPVSILSAGRNDEHYTGRVQALNFVQLFAERGLGAYIEKLRDQWASRFEFVLIDSRTGITDIGGICTIHLPDVLVLLFTTTDPSVNGVIEVMERAREEQARLPFDRQRLIAVPVPAKDESRTEYERATKWKRLFADRFADLYKDWLPADKTPFDALELLRIPYIPYWSFGEPLPVVEEGTSDPMSLGFAYQLLAKLIAADLEWQEFAAPVARFEREWDQRWLESHREKAKQGLAKTGRKGFMEIRFYSPNAVINRMQDELLAAAKHAEIRTFGWPIGVVLDNRPDRPRPTGEGIVADIAEEHDYDYWTLTKQGDFYALMSLFEDKRVQAENVIFFNTRIVRITEALLYCSGLYRALGANGNSLVRFGLRHGGLRGRELTAAGDRAVSMYERVNPQEDEVDTEVQFLLGTLESQLIELVQKLCEPLFMVFDFARFERSIYGDIVGKFLKGQAT